VFVGTMMTSIKSMVYGEEVDDNTIAMFDQSPSNLVDERSSKTSYPVSSGRQLLDSGAERSLPTTMVKHQPSNAVQHEQFSSWMGESLSRQANKRMRRLVGQSWLTNRFGDASVEEAFCEYLRHHQLKYIKRVLLLFGFLFAALAIYQQSLLNFESDHRGAGGVLEAGVSMMMARARQLARAPRRSAGTHPHPRPRPRPRGAGQRHGRAHLELRLRRRRVGPALHRRRSGKLAAGRVCVRPRHLPDVPQIALPRLRGREEAPRASSANLPRTFPELSRRPPCSRRR